MCYHTREMGRETSRDTALIRRSLEGDAGSYGKLVDRYSGRIVNLAFVMLGDRHQAEDVAQEAFIRAFRSLPKFERRSKFSSWLYQIALNLCKDHMKSRSRRAKSLDGEVLTGMEEGDTSVGAPRQAMKTEFSGALQETLDRLPYVYRECFVLRHLQDLEYGEIAGITGVSADTVRVRAYRAREMLKKELGPQVDTYWRERAARGRGGESPRSSIVGHRKRGKPEER